MVNQTAVAPASLAEFSALLKEASGPIYGQTGLRHPFAVPLDPNHGATLISLESYTGIVEHDVSDQVVVVRAGTTVEELQEELGKRGQCLPLPKFEGPRAPSVAASYGPLIDEIGFNLPHALFSQCGSWRDWILGMTVVQADGTIARCGSKAVKNVAGYDVQKLLIGARGTLGIIGEVIFKTYPLHALPSPTVQFGSLAAPADLIQRTLRADFSATSFYGDLMTAADAASSTVWARIGDGEVAKFDEGWTIRAGRMEFRNETQIRFMKRAKEIFDPLNRLNPGALGIL